jgi:predicted permease
VLLFTLALAVVTGLLFGLVPALQATRPELVVDLKDVGGQSHRRRLGTRELLVVGQVALSFVALLGSGLFLRSLTAATEIDLGFEPQGLVTLTLDPGSNGYEQERAEPFFDAVLERTRSVPGVESATLASIVPLTRADMYQTVLIEGRAREDRNNGLMTLVGTVSEDYFRTVGLRLVAGRALDERDRAGALPVAVITSAMARSYWPGEEALGRRFRFLGEEPIEVVGVVETPQLLTVGEDPQPLVFLPQAQSYRGSMNLVARVAAGADMEAMLGTLRRVLQPLDPTLAITGVQTVEAAVGGSLWAARMGAGLLAALGGVALLLAAIGIYGVMSWAVSQRSRELGIRIALGANRARVLTLVLGRALLVVGCGLGVGVLLALPLGQTLETLLYGVSPGDPSTVAGTVLVLLVVALVASLLPARRATAVDPVRVLRFER